MTNNAFAPAKVNLSLHVTGQQADGYHLLDSLVVFADIGDRLWFESGPDMRIEVSGPFADGVPTDHRNLVWQAAELAGWTGRINLEKNLPHGAGIGGGSADAAAVLRTLGGDEGAASLGADVPVCLSASPQRMQGIGDDLAKLPPLPDMDILLINPKVEVPTGPVFNALDCKENQPMPEAWPRFDSLEVFCDWLAQQRNDLERPARQIAPQIDDVLGALSGAQLARMSGSGATCFGLFEAGKAQPAAKRVAAAHPDWWVAAGRVLS
ncbi:4-(cytidine 5'-diphospho)-2-C-methyl-D-erythritol kinase [Sulfitobacter donghicola]|uniref:4-(cytidine 5'-diphospho)-2-C-methyl-D-erythritol kinase n=1 Tax=Sulfitobacter donghicola TaxID=421000 RepID=UPI00056BE05E|nr:4-(cytidine 5'-diphospho)-2-C-methyl-D-erythritol kinase [Sulfitobacter donghicola]KIN68579.1 4-diphosphocytidyl-2-C-methyl-D-erythritol kinase [Sulfitobacter donghicola DSW-25 = KCTC 12864 = JCM 14565]